MDWYVVLGCALIFVARLFDVSLDTLRMISVIRGRRGWAWVFGFLQVTIWIYAISYAMKNITQPAYALAYALGFACGNFVGVTIETWLAHGEQVLRVFTRPEFSEAMAARLRGHGYGVTIIEGRGKEGIVNLLYVEAPRKHVIDATRLCRAMDPDCFYVIDDVRAVSTAGARRRAAMRPITAEDLKVSPLSAAGTPASAHAGAGSGSGPA